ncbi:hypothetical protein JYU34_004814 [Plutella xylostella]|uniref:Uncharacterized protein n=1 Tax=Plutella xylostella TaxID=51655 RepID=A0ABQ7QYX0_PLUXY|nr:hypothetical protein JYU34_004814 [Plutella xylostella]
MPPAAARARGPGRVTADPAPGGPQSTPTYYMLMPPQQSTMDLVFLMIDPCNGIPGVSCT